MARRYEISVTNQSGAQQDYALFNQAPSVTGSMPGQVWSHVFATGNTPERSTATFTIYSQYYAIIGSSQGSPSEGVAVDVTSEQAVTLGSKSADGSNIPGTSLAMEVQDGAPQFNPSPLPNGSYIGAFEVKSGHDFTVSEAVNGNYVIGLGSSNDGQSNDGPLATFVPEPGVDYQIQPSSTYYITCGDYTRGAIIDPNKIGASIAIDFTRLPSDVRILHDDHGNFNIQA